MHRLTPGINPAIDAQTCKMVNAAMESAPNAYAETEYSHDEFLEYARNYGMMKEILEFLTDRGDLAGASPAAWMQLSNVGTQDWHGALHENTRRQITIFIIGQSAFDRYVEWLLAKHLPKTD